MKKAMICAVTSVLLLFLLSGEVLAQRMLPGQSGLQVQGGMIIDNNAPGNHFFSFGTTTYKKNGNYRFWELGMVQETAPYRETTVPLKTYLLEGGYMFFLFGDAGRNFTVNAGASVFGGISRNNNGNRHLYDGALIVSRSGLLYGASAIMGMDTFLSDRFVLLLQGKARALRGNWAGRNRYSLGIGVRINFK